MYLNCTKKLNVYHSFTKLREHVHKLMTIVCSMGSLCMLDKHIVSSKCIFVLA